MLKLNIDQEETGIGIFIPVKISCLNELKSVLEEMQMAAVAHVVNVINDVQIHLPPETARLLIFENFPLNDQKVNYKLSLGINILKEQDERKYWYVSFLEALFEITHDVEFTMPDRNFCNYIIKLCFNREDYVERVIPQYYGRIYVLEKY